MVQSINRISETGFNFHGSGASSCDSAISQSSLRLGLRSFRVHHQIRKEWLQVRAELEAGVVRRLNGTGNRAQRQGSLATIKRPIGSVS